MVYVPAYDPWLVYGALLFGHCCLPSWIRCPGIFWGGRRTPRSVIGFGSGLLRRICGGGCASLGYDCPGRRGDVTNHNTYLSPQPRTISNRRPLQPATAIHGDSTTATPNSTMGDFHHGKSFPWVFLRVSTRIPEHAPARVMA